jgi:hypothetical protein
LSVPGRRERRHGGAPSAAADRGAHQHGPTTRRSVHAAPMRRPAPKRRTGGTCGGGSAASAAPFPAGIPDPPSQDPCKMSGDRTNC